VSVLAYVLASDDRLSGRILEWRPPRWVRVWMLTATRLGDGWLWLATAALLVVSGNRGLQVLSAGAVSAGVANALLGCVKRRVRRARPCERAKPRHFDVDPLAWFPSDRFSFPSGHALNSFAIGSVIALAFPFAAVPVLVLAASVAASRVVPRCSMAVKILWQPPLVPEERKKAQWENIIRFELGEGIDGLDVSLRFAEERLRWQLDTVGAPPDYAAVYRGRLVDALRAAGKPVE